MVAEVKPSIWNRVRDFYHEVMTEMSKVTWPTKEELKSSTTVVLWVLVVLAGVIYVYDFIFQVTVLGLLRSLAR